MTTLPAAAEPQTAGAALLVQFVPVKYVPDSSAPATLPDAPVPTPTTPAETRLIAVSYDPEAAALELQPIGKPTGNRAPPPDTVNISSTGFVPPIPKSKIAALRSYIPSVVL